METNISFSPVQFNRLFPFFILIDDELIVQSCGSTLEKLFPKTSGSAFHEYYSIKRPAVEIPDFHSLCLHIDQLVVVECKDEEGTNLRGQLVRIPGKDQVVFIGSPWFGSMEDVRMKQLNLNDFAYHDPMIDLLHVLKTQEITNEDLKHLLSTVNRQKNDLKKASREIHDIALFPMQNPDPLIRIDLEGNVLRQNPSAEDLMDFVYNDKTYTAAQFWKVIASNCDDEADRTVVEAKSGETIYSFVIKLLPEDGYYNIYGRDINEQKKLELELIKAKNKAEASTRTKDIFLANMSHEIRTPMNAIMGMSNQMVKTQLNDEQKFYLNTIRSSTDNLLVILNDILDLSKIEAGKLALEQIGFNPNDVVARVMQVMMHKAEEKGLKFTNSYFDPKLSHVLKGDPYRLNQVLLNLVSNAIKFTEKGSVDIRCSSVQEDEYHQTMEIRISDTGIGMDQTFLQNLFQKFSQEDDSTTRRYGGTGLGMNICNQLIALMHGQIDVESKKGIGTTVTVRLNLEKGTELDLPEQEMEVTNTKDIYLKKILVVDDNEMNRLVATTILLNYGALIHEASDGAEAVEMIRNEDFDLVLMDVQMPVMGGMEAVRIIREEISRELPIIALTAFAVKGQDKKNLEAGMNDYLSKPFQENQLLRLVTKWIKKDAKSPAKKILEEAPRTLYDLSKLQEIARGDNEFVEKMTRLFVDLAMTSVKDMRQAYEAKNFSAIKRIAHRLKPSIDNMNIVTIKDEIREMESKAESYQTSQRLENLIDRVDSILNQVTGQIKSRKR